VPTDAPARDALLVDDRTAAAMLSISRAHLHRLRSAGHFVPGVKIGRCLRFRAADLQTFVDCECDIVRWRGFQAMEGRRSARAV
jgi:predicted DNA-binding transcriptional regulator AlpA